jgi:hypothetical protein
MVDKESHDQQMERVMNYLANSVLELSDEEIRAEAAAIGDLEQQAERTRNVLRNAASLLETVNKALQELGHTVSPQRWQQHDRGYRNQCLTCGLAVSFALGTGEMWGSALQGTCPQTERAVRKRAASAR